MVNSNNALAKSIVIAGDNWCPINCTQDSEDKGFMIDLAIEALALSDHQVTYVEVPWTRAVELASKGEVDAIVGAFKNDAPDFIYPQTPLLNISPNNLFTTQDNEWVYQNINSLNDVNIGVITGYDYGDKLNSYLFSKASAKVQQIYGNNAPSRNIQRLLKKRIDVLVETGPVFWYHAKKLNVLHQVKQVGSVSKSEPCYIAFSPFLPSSKDISIALDKGVEILRQQGRVKEIADYYGLPAKLYQ